MSDLKPFIVYSLGPSANPWKVSLVLEELGLPWKFELVEPSKLKQEPFISLNPNGRVPALVDPNTGITLWESGAIVDYLVDVYDKDARLHYTSFPEKHITRCWEHFQMSGQGPYFGQKSWFEKFHPEKLPSAIERYSNEIKRVLGVIDTHLRKQGTPYLVGDKITYADLMFLPWHKLIGTVLAPEIDLSPWTEYNAWTDRMLARPAVAKVYEEWTRQFIAKVKADEEARNKKEKQ